MARRRPLLARSLTILASLALVALAAGPRRAFAGVDTWTSGGPPGASVNSLVVDPTSSRTVYAATDIGVFKSVDGGGSWTRSNAGMENDNGDSPFVASLAIDPRAPATLYAGGRKGGNVYKSTDGGGSWRAVAALGEGFATAVRALAIDPSNSQIVYAAAPTASYKGVFKSTNGGQTWHPINNGLPPMTILGITIGVLTPNCLAVDPDRPSTLYANPGWIYASTDAGASWQKRTEALPWPVSQTLCGRVAVDPSSPGTAYRADITVLDSMAQEFAVLIRRTTDEGATWNVFGNGLSGQCGQALAIDATGRSLHMGTQNTSPCPLAPAGAGVFDFEITRPPDPRHRVVPVVLDVTTASAHYTTELTLTNDTPEARPVELVYTAALGSNEGSGSVSDRLAAGEQRRIPDVLGYLRSKGLALPDLATQWSQGGTLQVITTEPDVGPGRFSVLARTASDTAAPLPPGRAGLAYTSMQTLPGYRALRVYGLRSNETDRSNLAVVNTSGDPMSFRVTVFSGSGDGKSAVVSDGLALPPYGWTQINSPDLLDRAGITNGWALVERTSDLGGLNAYGVVNDRVTNDGSFLAPVAGSGVVGMLPVLVETPAFRSELVLTNRSDVDVDLELRYVESLSPELGGGGVAAVTLPAKQQWIMPDAIDYLRRKGVGIGAPGPGYAGSLQVTWRGYGGLAYLGARTSARAPRGGAFGLFTSGIEGTDAGKVAVYGLVADERNRSNVAVVNAGPDPRDWAAVTLSLQVHDGDAGGAARGKPLEVTLAPGQWKQFDDVLAASGVANGWVEITVTGSGYGLISWLAYGVINDGRAPGDRTGDGAYVPMTP